MISSIIQIFFHRQILPHAGSRPSRSKAEAKFPAGPAARAVAKAVAGGVALPFIVESFWFFHRVTVFKKCPKIVDW